MKFKYERFYLRLSLEKKRVRNNTLRIAFLNKLEEYKI